ncbi:Oidioi.mRNA.OKI2018_I69.chr2.g5060.t2.cds [Oikopleura dioica]|uniref:Oidioi.mRNA.OKI2018_I69.chr2.g5060.t2.cds n=1 Tax=Oikopleura dioica TaxID=34765 RepID=A0ABN7T2L3_OIKDI|nr:Oidioi.mRNA.OKI2018_I69.chr2.g5060.t2.cds [Oikopleura dioica]
MRGQSELGNGMLCAADKIADSPGTVKATIEVDIRHVKFHGDWRGFVRLQANFLVYHGRETGMDVQLNKISVSSNVSEDVPNIDDAVVAALSRGFQINSTGSSSRQLTQQDNMNTSQLSLDKSNTYSSGYSSARYSQNEVSGVNSRRLISEEESGRESRASRFSVRDDEQTKSNRERKISRESRHSVKIQERNDAALSSQPPKPSRASRNSTNSSRTPKSSRSSRSSHGASSRRKAVETVKICPVRIELYHEWDNIKPRLNVTYGSKTVAFDGIQSEHGDEIFDFDTSSPLIADFKNDDVVDLSLTVRDQGKWLSIGKGTVDLENVRDNSITLELSDPEETICELTLKVKRSKPKSEVIFDDRVQFSPSRRTDIYPESQANSTIRTSMAMTESSMDGVETDQNTLETSHNDHDSWIDQNLVDEVCRVHKLPSDRQNDTSTPIPSPLARGDDLRSTLPIAQNYGSDNRPRKMSLQDVPKQQNPLDLLQIPTENSNRFPASPKTGKSGLKKFFGKFKRSRPGSRNRSEVTTPTIPRK